MHSLGHAEASVAAKGVGDGSLGNARRRGVEDETMVSADITEDQCAICLTEFENGEVLRKMPWYEARRRRWWGRIRGG